MLEPPLLATYFLLVGLSLHVLAFLLYRHDPHDPKLRFVTVVTVLLGVVSLAVALLLWVGDSPATKAAFTSCVRADTEAHRWTPAEELGERD